jgi:hypothetical protein
MTLALALALSAAGCAPGSHSTSGTGSRADRPDVTYKYTYTCDGGTGDVTFAVENAKEDVIYAQNTEAGARFVATSKSLSMVPLKADENDPDTDSDLMGTNAKVSKGAFDGAAKVTLVLEGGESAATYHCTFDDQ